VSESTPPTPPTGKERLLSAWAEIVFEVEHPAEPKAEPARRKTETPSETTTYAGRSAD